MVNECSVQVNDAHTEFVCTGEVSVVFVVVRLLDEVIPVLASLAADADLRVVRELGDDGAW